MVGGGQHRGGDREDSFLGTPPGFQARELSLQIGAFDAYRGPGGRDQSHFRPIDIAAVTGPDGLDDRVVGITPDSRFIASQYCLRLEDSGNRPFDKDESSPSST